MRYPSETETSLFFPCTAGTRGVTPNPTPSPSLAFLLPPAHRAGMLRAPLMGRPQFRAQKDKLWQILLWRYKKLVPPAVCLFGGYPLSKGSTCQRHSYLTTKSTILTSVVDEGGFNLQHRITYGKEEEQTSGSDHFLGWHAKPSPDCACQHPCHIGVIPGQQGLFMWEQPQQDNQPDYVSVQCLYVAPTALPAPASPAHQLHPTLSDRLTRGHLGCTAQFE